MVVGTQIAALAAFLTVWVSFFVDRAPGMNWHEVRLAVLFSIPCIALYGFARILKDVRLIRIRLFEVKADIYDLQTTVVSISPRWSASACMTKKQPAAPAEQGAGNAGT